MPEFRLGDFAHNIESGWLGKIVAFEGQGPDRMAVLIGVDFLAHQVVGLGLEESLSTDDRQWHWPADLVLFARLA